MSINPWEDPDSTAWMAKQERHPIAPAAGVFLWSVACRCCDLGFCDKKRSTAWNLFLDHYSRDHMGVPEAPWTVDWGVQGPPA